MKSATRNYDTLALLGACSLFLSTLEFLIPKPIPFMRLGLANLPILVSLSFLSPGQIISLTVIKIVGQGLVNGTLFSYVFLFSASGSFASSLVMLVSYRLLRKGLSLVGVGVLGSLASNGAQLFISRYLLFGESAWLLAPPFLALGTVTALILGLFAEGFTASSRWVERQVALFKEGSS